MAIKFPYKIDPTLALWGDYCDAEAGSSRAIENMICSCSIDTLTGDQARRDDVIAVLRSLTFAQVMGMSQEIMEGMLPKVSETR